MANLTEKQLYLQLHSTQSDNTSGATEQLITAPLISLAVKSTTEGDNDTSLFPQYGFLGCALPHAIEDADSDTNTDTGSESALPEPILLNTNTPWSAFLCGSQGSGKSHTLAVMLENCLFPSSRIGQLPKPLAGIVFHNNTSSKGNICEAAHLASLGVKVNVFVSRSNYFALNDIYKGSVASKGNLNISPLIFQSQHLNAQRMYRLMAFSDQEGPVPLYMEVIMRILREMAITSPTFNYKDFKTNLDNENLLPTQRTTMDMRLCLLESFLDMSCMKLSKKAQRNTKSPDIFVPEPGTLTIIDLSDPFLNASTTCTLFDICLSLFSQNRPEAGMLVALDEAHRFLNASASGSADIFTDHLLQTIREQRHNATRIVVATQEPTISPKLLDLCSMTLVHRFTSPDWLATLRSHLAAASPMTADAEHTLANMFEEIVTLDTGESLLFAPSATLGLVGRKPKKLGVKYLKFKTRRRLGVDGGRSVLAVREEDTDDNSLEEEEEEEGETNLYNLIGVMKIG